MTSQWKPVLISLGSLVVAAYAADTVKAVHAAFLDDDPLWAEPKPRPIGKVASIDIDNLYDFVDESFIVPRAEKKIERHGGDRARDVNTIGEVPDSEWFTNRKGRLQMSLEELKRGPGNAHPPDPNGKWCVVSAKTEGVTPGITIEDDHDVRYLLKFDPPDYPELASAPDVIGSKVYYALGYNTPENYIVRFRRDQLTLTESSTWKDVNGKKHVLTAKMIDKMLADQPRDAAGSYRAMASRWIPGTPIGPFVFQGTRSDDPNDIVPHELRRELRGMAVFASWINDTDAKALNTLDSVVGPPGAQYIEHFRIDWGASLGSDSLMPKDIRRGHDYFVDPKAMLVEGGTFGFDLPVWMRAHYPKIRGVGNFDYRSFDASKWRSNYPAAPFLLMDNEDAFWAAKKVMSFSDQEIRALVETGEYSDPRATAWVTECLIKRREKIGQAWLSRGLALDNFHVEQGRLMFDDLAANYGIERTRTYKVAWSVFNNLTREKRSIAVDGWTIPRVSPSDVFLAAVIGLQTGQAGSGEITAYLRNSGGAWTVVGVDRKYE